MSELTPEERARALGREMSHMYRVTQLKESLDHALNRAGGRELPLPCAICGSTETCKVEIDWQEGTALWTCRNPQPVEG